MTDIGQDFFSTVPGQFIANSHRYLSAARILRSSDLWSDGPSILQTPTLHLIAHGIELLLKYPLVRGGMDEKAVAKQFGHDLLAIWQLPDIATLRALIELSAEQTWALARDSGSYPNDDFEKEPVTELNAALRSLAHLHGRDSNFALRYTVEEDATAPRPQFLIDAFGYVAERVAMNPRYADDQ